MTLGPEILTVKDLELFIKGLRKGNVPSETQVIRLVNSHIALLRLVQKEIVCKTAATSVEPTFEVENEKSKKK